MKVYVILRINEGMPMELKAYANAESARIAFETNVQENMTNNSTEIFNGSDGGLYWADDRENPSFEMWLEVVEVET